MDTTLHFGHIVKRYVKQDERSAKEIAQLLGMSPRTLYKMYSKPDLDTGVLRRLETILGVEILRPQGKIQGEGAPDINSFVGEAMARFSPDEIGLVIAKLFLTLREEHMRMAREFKDLIDRHSLLVDEIRLTKKRNDWLGQNDAN